MMSDILQILSQHKGKANAIKVPQLAAMVGVNERKVRQGVHDLREQGHLIWSGSEGYCIPVTADEYDRCIGRLTSRVIELMRVIRKMSVVAKVDFPREQILMEMSAHD